MSQGWEGHGDQKRIWADVNKPHMPPTQCEHCIGAVGSGGLVMIMGKDTRGMERVGRQEKNTEKNLEPRLEGLEGQ